MYVRVWGLYQVGKICESEYRREGRLSKKVGDKSTDLAFPR